MSKYHKLVYNNVTQAQHFSITQATQSVKMDNIEMLMQEHTQGTGVLELHFGGEITNTDVTNIKNAVATVLGLSTAATDQTVPMANSKVRTKADTQAHGHQNAGAGAGPGGAMC